MAKLTFCSWLNTQLDRDRRDDFVADLAYDCKYDTDTPRGNASFYTWQKYLFGHVDRDSPVIEAFYVAWQEYEPECQIMKLMTSDELLDMEYEDSDLTTGWWVEGYDQNGNVFTLSLDAESYREAAKMFIDDLKMGMPKAKIVVGFVEHIDTGRIYKECGNVCDWPNAKPIQPTSVTLRMRFQVMRRDNYRCRICGRSSADDVTLEVDHKLARANGGTSQMDNLWVLCFDCNRGKSDLMLQ